MKHIASGKVREIYELSDDQLLIVSTDRISAFDHVLGSPIPGKGKVLTQLSLFWFDYLKNLVPNHLISVDVNSLPAEYQPYPRVLGHEGWRFPLASSNHVLIKVTQAPATSRTWAPTSLQPNQEMQ